MSYPLLKDDKPVLRDGQLVLVPNASGNSGCECCDTTATCDDVNSSTKGTGGATFTMNSNTSGPPCGWTNCNQIVPHHTTNYVFKSYSASVGCEVVYRHSTGDHVTLKYSTSSYTDATGQSRPANAWAFVATCWGKHPGGGQCGYCIGSGPASVSISGGAVVASGAADYMDFLPGFGCDPVAFSISVT